MPARSSKPLFELVRVEIPESREAASEDPKPTDPNPSDSDHTDSAPINAADHIAEDAGEPTGNIETNPVRIPPPGGTRSASSPAATSARRTSYAAPEPALGVVRVPRRNIYLAISLVLLLLLLAWVGGYVTGVRTERREQARSLAGGTGDLLISDPIGQGDDFTEAPEPEDATLPRPNRGSAGSSSSGGSPVVIRQGTTSGSTALPPPGSPLTDPAAIAATGSGPVITSRGMVQQDPRVPGVNYLHLARMTYAHALDAVAYLAENGVEAIGVPLDPGARAGNNRGQYLVVSVEVPVPGSQFGEMAGERRRHQDEVARIGQRWRTERRGVASFAASQTVWARYAP